MKNKSQKLKITKTECSTYISEAQEYSMKKQSVSLSQTRIIGSNIDMTREQNINKLKVKKTGAPITAHYVLFLERQFVYFQYVYVFFLWSYQCWILLFLFERETRSAFSQNTLVLHLYMLSIRFSLFLASSSCFSCISYSELLVLLQNVLSCFTYIYLES